MCRCFVMTARNDFRGISPDAAGQFMAFVLLTAVLSAACLADEFPQRAEVYELAEHIRELPPYRSDITVIVEFDIKPLPEVVIRRSVEDSYHEIDQQNGRIRDAATFQAAVDQEVARRLQEQSLPRRIKERWRREGMRYRVDEVRTLTGLEVIDASTPFHRSFIYLADSPSAPRDTAKLNWRQRIKTLYGERHGNVQQSREVWTGGTVGLGVVTLLKLALGMELHARHGETDPVENSVTAIVEGTHPALDLRVDRKDDARHFQIRPRRGGGLIRFTTPRDRIEPVSFVEITDAAGAVTYRMEVQESDSSGTATRWTEDLIRIRSVGLEHRKFVLLERHLNEPLEDDTFSTERPEGWTLSDRRPEKHTVIGPDGMPLQVHYFETDSSGAEKNWQPRPRTWVYFWIGQAGGLLILVSLWLHRTRQRNEPPKSSSSDAPADRP